MPSLKIDTHWIPENLHDISIIKGEGDMFEKLKEYQERASDEKIGIRAFYRQKLIECAKRRKDSKYRSKLTINTRRVAADLLADGHNVERENFLKACEVISQHFGNGEIAERHFEPNELKSLLPEKYHKMTIPSADLIRVQSELQENLNATVSSDSLFMKTLKYEFIHSETGTVNVLEHIANFKLTDKRTTQEQIIKDCTEFYTMYCS